MKPRTEDEGNILPFKHISIKPLIDFDYEVILNKA